MAATFIKIKEFRLIKTAIKKYLPNGETNLNIYYSPSRNKVDVETYEFPTKKKRDDMITILDGLFL